MMRIFHLLLLLLLPTVLRAQSVAGTVVDQETGQPLRGVRVGAVNSGLSVLTDGQGHFSIEGKGGETFHFTAPGYTQQMRRAPEYVGNVPWKIQMQLFSVSLGEVRVKPFAEGYQRDSFERAKTYQRPLARQKSGGMSPVSMLAERFSKKQRRLFAFQEEFYRIEDEKFIDTRYTPQLTAELTQLSGDTLAHFMNANPMPYDFARAASDLEIKMWIKDRYKSWVKQTPAPPPTKG